MLWLTLRQRLSKQTSRDFDRWRSNADQGARRKTVAE